MRTLVIALLFTLPLPAVSDTVEVQATSNEGKLITTLAALDTNDPASDARKNFGNGDSRFAGICGYSCDAPGLQGNDLRLRVNRQELRILDGSGCVSSGKEHQRLRDQAYKYAIAYNRELAKLLAPVPMESN
jgi:outer membrane lipoprotein LolB